MVKIVGRYQLESSENFDEFLRELGVNFLLRSIAKTSKPTIEVTYDESTSTYTIRTITALKNSEIKFKLGEEFEESRLDNNTVKTTVVMEGDDTLVQTQQGDKEVKIIRTFSDTHLKTVCIVGKATSTRVYKRTD